MPTGDGTGPMGMGPMSGRGAGYCAGYGVPGYMNPAGGRGFGRGRGGWGRGMGWGRGGRGAGAWGAVPYAAPYAAPGYAGPAGPYAAPGYAGPAGPYAAPSREEEISALKEQTSYFEQAMKDIQERIKELEAEKK